MQKQRHALLFALVAALVMSLASVAAAEPPATLTHQGRLLDVDQRPISGIQPMVFSLHAGESDEEDLWVEALDLALDNGYYTVTLGMEEPLPRNVFDGSPLYLSIAVDGTAFEPRIELTSVPYAFLAGEAGNATGDITPRTVTVGDQLIIDETGAWVGPAAADTLGALSCENGALPIFDADADEWGCGEFPEAVAVVAGEGIDVARDAEEATVSVVFAGDGQAPTAARSDHGHGPAGVPLGTVIDWWRPSDDFPIPDGYAVADGRVVADDTSPFFGQALPDLRNRFVRGVNTPSDIGEQGGADSHAHVGAGTDTVGAHTPSGAVASAGGHAHGGQSSEAGAHTPAGSSASAGNHSHVGTTSNGGIHTHGLPSNTGSVSLLATNPGNHSYYVEDDNRGFRTDNHLAVDSGASADEGHHRHTLGGNTGSGGTHAHTITANTAGSHDHALQMNAVAAHRHAIQSDGAHVHGLTMEQVPGHAHAVAIPTAAHMPRYVGLLKLIRIR
jgi:hypothetical protein